MSTEGITRADFLKEANKRIGKSGSDLFAKYGVKTHWCMMQVYYLMHDVCGINEFPKTFSCSGFTATDSNFSGDSIVFKQGNIVTFSIILTINSGTTCNPHTLLGTIDAKYRPSQTIVLPGILVYESKADPAACGVNVNNDGTVRYYGISAAAGRHICINGSYLLK